MREVYLISHSGLRRQDWVFNLSKVRWTLLWFFGSVECVARLWFVGFSFRLIVTFIIDEGEPFTSFMSFLTCKKCFPASLAVPLLCHVFTLTLSITIHALPESDFFLFIFLIDFHWFLEKVNSSRNLQA